MVTHQQGLRSQTLENPILCCGSCSLNCLCISLRLISGILFCFCNSSHSVAPRHEGNSQDGGPLCEKAACLTSTAVSCHGPPCPVYWFFVPSLERIQHLSGFDSVHPVLLQSGYWLQLPHLWRKVLSECRIRSLSSSDSCSPAGWAKTELWLLQEGPGWILYLTGWLHQ